MRAPVVIDLCDSSPEPAPAPAPRSAHQPRHSQQLVLEDDFITPSNSDSDDAAPTFIWPTRKRKNDTSTQSVLKSNISPRPSNKQKHLPPSQRLQNTTTQTSSQSRIQPSIRPPPTSHLSHKPLQSNAQQQPLPPSQTLSLEPSDKKPVSIVSAGAQQWLSQRSRTATPLNYIPPRQTPHSALPDPIASQSTVALADSHDSSKHHQTSIQSPKAPKPATHPVQAPVSRPSFTPGSTETATSNGTATSFNSRFFKYLTNGKRKLKEVESLDDNAESDKRLRRDHPSNTIGSEVINLIEDDNDEPANTGLNHSRDQTKDAEGHFTFPDDISTIQPFPNNYGKAFTAGEDALLVYLKTEKKLSWRDFMPFFPGRSWESLQSRYSKNLKKRWLRNSTHSVAPTRSLEEPSIPAIHPLGQRNMPPTNTARTSRAVPHYQPLPAQQELENHDTDTPRCKRISGPLPYLMRHREMGLTGGRERPRQFQTAIKDLAYSTMGAAAFMDDASGDVSTVAWSPDGRFFAAGAVAVTDSQSMQYNKPRNLVFGDPMTLQARELPEHRLTRTQDGRQKEVYSTVQTVAFSPDSHFMYSVGIDQHLNTYKINHLTSDVDIVSRLWHPASVDFLSVSNDGLVATGCSHSGAGAIRVLNPGDGASADAKYFSGSNLNNQNRKHPSALKWGMAAQHKNLLLAGFSCEAEVFYADDDQRDKEGEVALWDASTQQQIEVVAPNRNVFDLAWNPNASSSSTQFAVASGVIGRVGHGIHSVVRLYCPNGSQARYLVELECPAWDINDVLYSPHDDHVIAAGSTEGQVFIWDIRYVKQSQVPLATLQHDESIAVLPHYKKRWEADTGVRFLSWGAERDRLFTGSSDGVVKCWDPYRSDQDKHIRDVAEFNSAIMSGAFSPDHDSLLIGEDNSRLNLMSLGNDDAKFDAWTKKFKVDQAPLMSDEPQESVDCEELLASGGLVVKPAGGMPFRQVVQGPNYDGPYLEDEEARYKARRFQDLMLRTFSSRKRQLKLLGYPVTDQCQLDCGHIPRFPLPKGDDSNDSKRWIDRIPDRLRDQVAPGGAGNPLGRTTKCSTCGGAARSMVCERCEFACFRCGKAASVSPRERAIECGNCGLAWMADALGYKLVEENNEKAARRGQDEEENEVEEMDELGDGEREYFLTPIEPADESHSDSE